ncbi:RNA polymerase 2 mediator complex component [Phaeosphaeria sp. MPI-PUGE-AT-0046c]|nr:RNA polymerase 2 mediator complex component [Phaeosphaeria sp. MPI-PUGE-AT-0046c]
MTNRPSGNSFTSAVHNQLPDPLQTRYSGRDHWSLNRHPIMPKHVGPNACSACARTKRRCGRQIPSCARCTDKNLDCFYPLYRERVAPYSRLLLPNSPNETASRFGDREPGTTAVMLEDDPTLDLSLSPLGRNYVVHSPFLHGSSTIFDKTDWFLAPDTWGITHDGDAAASEAVTRATMKEYIALMQSWMERWCRTGSNPFIHHRLYTSTFPACLQIAYATLASYLHRAPANTDIVLRIVEDRSADLLCSNGAVLDKFIANEWACEESEQDVDLLSQLSRLHALMVYQIIGLFDGDTRARYVAEGRMGVQVSWASRLYRSAAIELSNSQSVAIHLVGPMPTSSVQHHWYLWILSESIRRTWLVALSMSCVFSALQQRWSACPGGIMYTNRGDLWDVTTAAKWRSQCGEKNPWFLQRFECAKLFDVAKPADIDEFGIAMLDMTVGREAVEQWRIDCS